METLIIGIVIGIVIGYIATSAVVAVIAYKETAKSQKKLEDLEKSIRHPFE